MKPVKNLSRYRGTEYKVDFITKTKLEVIIEDEMADLAVQQISLSARTGEIGDGKIFVSDIHETIRIRTKATGISAI
jgi:nitrogen regulatory protein P-II 1